MPITQAGKQFTADQLQLDAGQMAAMLRDTAQKGLQFKTQQIGRASCRERV